MQIFVQSGSCRGQELKEMSSVRARPSRACEGGGLTALLAWSSGSRRPHCLVGNRTEEERWHQPPFLLGTSSFSSLERQTHLWPFMPPAPDHVWWGRGAGRDHSFWDARKSGVSLLDRKELQSRRECSSVRAAIIKNHGLGGFNSRHLFSQSSES